MAVTSRYLFPLILNTTRPFLRILAVGYSALISKGPFHRDCWASLNHARNGCWALWPAGLSQNSRKRLRLMTLMDKAYPIVSILRTFFEHKIIPASSAATGAF